MARTAGSLRLVATLAAAGAASGLVLVTAHLLTAPRIERNRAEALRAAIYRVLPGTADIAALQLVDGVLARDGEGSGGDVVYACRDDAGRLVGYAIPAEGPGFMDTIKVLYGFDPKRRTIVGLEVLESRETPGLGDEISRDPQFLASFRSLAVEPRIEPVKRGERDRPNEVDCITGATISSEAVVQILNRSMDRWLPILRDTESEEAGP